MSSSLTPESVWPRPPETLAQQVCQSVLAVTDDAVQPLAQIMQTLTSAPSTTGAQAFFASIKPLLAQNLTNLFHYSLRNVFSLPSDINPSVIVAALQSEHVSNDHALALDREIAAIRARIRHYDNQIARLTAVEKTAHTQAASLRAASSQAVAPQQFHALCADIKAAERDFAQVANILKEHKTNNAPSNQPLLTAAANVLAKPRHIPTTSADPDENTITLRPSEEHEPLNHMPTAQGILGISMGADADKLQDLALLRSRLLG